MSLVGGATWPSPRGVHGVHAEECEEDTAGHRHDRWVRNAGHQRGPGKRAGGTAEHAWRV